MSTYKNYSGGGGGRIIPGTGGSGGISTTGNRIGGDGGTAGNAGDSGESTVGAGGGGGWGASGGTAVLGYTNDGGSTRSPGGGGKAVNLNGYSVTWSGTFSTDFSNRVFGSVS